MEKSRVYAQKTITMLESEPMEGYKIRMYISSLYAITTIQNFMGKYAEAMQNVQKIRDIGKVYPQFVKNFPPEAPFRLSVVLETDLYLRIPDYETGVARIPHIEAGLKKFGHKMNMYNLNNIYFNISLLYFGTRDYHKALYWVNKILNENKDDYTLDVICGAKIFFLIIHIELENDDLLEYAAKSTHHYLTTRKRKYKVESIFLDLLKIILNPDRKKDLPEIYSEMLIQFNKLKADPYEKGAFEFFDFISWLESKISGKPFAEIARSRQRTDSAF